VIEAELGFLVPFLARARANMANRFILPQHREGRILDMGCGNYPFSYFLTTTAFAEKYGLDRVFANGGDEAAEELGIRLMAHDMTSASGVPFGDNYFDIVTMLGVFEHIEPTALEPLMAEIYRLLKPGGRYVMTTPARWTGPLLQGMAKLGLVSAASIADHKDSYSHAVIRGLLLRGGFSAAQVKLGHFELFMNNYAVATK
jgi:SAM-dependent methyltransferase